MSRKHHPFSPSSLEAIAACPLYQSHEESNVAAEEGTLQHEMAETLEDNETLLDDRAAEVAWCLQQVDALSSDISDRPPDFELREARFKIPSEQPLPYDDPEFQNELTGGFVDLVRGWKTTALLCDYKFGKWPVTEARLNPQIKAYVAGLFLDNDTLDTIRACVLQPKLERYSVHDFRREDLPKILEEITAVVLRAAHARKDADFFRHARVGFPLCLFCRHAAKCPALTRVALEVGKKYLPAQIPDELDPTNITEISADGLRLAALVGTWAKAYSRQAAAGVLDGRFQAPPGYVLRVVRAREVKDAQAFKEVLLEHGLTEEDLWDAFTPSLTKAAGLIASRAPRGEKEKTIEQVNAALESAGAVEEKPARCWLEVQRHKANNE